jgi:quinol monooxygenase YgiN
MILSNQWSRKRSAALAAGATVLALLVGQSSISAGPAAGDQRITAVTLIHGIPGKEEELKAHLLSLAAPTRAEPGCITYDLYQSPDQRHEFMRFEVWASPDALEAHKQMPHIRASFQKRQHEGWTTQIVTWSRVPE